MTLEELRAQFPHVEDTIYLNHAATGVLSRRVTRVVQRYLAERHGGNINNYAELAPVLEATKEQLARLIGAPPTRVEFMSNTSSGLNVLAEGLDWQEGDRIAVPACEFPANVYPFLNQERHGVAVDFIPHEEGVITLEAIQNTLRPETRLLTISWVQFLSGFKVDLEEVGRLCRKQNVLLCVDAIQGLGALRLDVEASGIDFLACGGHKWLMGMQGTGFLYVTEALQEQITPLAGWLHGPVDWEHFFDYELQFHATAERFRLGTMNSAGIAALNAALSLYFEAGPAWCEKQVIQRARQLDEGLRALGLTRYGTAAPEHASGIVSIAHPHGEALQAYLQEQQIEAALRNRKLRFSPHYYNTPSEIQLVLEAIEQFDKKQGSALRESRDIVQ